MLNSPYIFGVWFVGFTVGIVLFYLRIICLISWPKKRSVLRVALLKFKDNSCRPGGFGLLLRNEVMLCYISSVFCFGFALKVVIDPFGGLLQCRWREGRQWSNYNNANQGLKYSIFLR